MRIEEILIIKNGTNSYGMSTDDINQISRVPTLMPLPLIPKGTRGLCGIGGNIISILDINLLLGMPEVDLKSPKSRLLTLSGEYASSSILVSEVYNTINIDEKNIEYTETKGDSVIAIYKYKDTLVQILSLDILISKINKVDIKSKDISNGKIKKTVEKTEDTNRFLIFSMSNERFAINIKYLREIILAYDSYTDIAGSPKDMLGLITLREELVSVIDLRLYYGFKSNLDDNNRILVISINDETIGVLVDKIIDIKNYLDEDVEYISDNFDNEKISGVIHDPESLISFFDKQVLERLFEQNKAYISSNSKNDKLEVYQDKVMEVIVFKIANQEYSFDVDNVAEIIDVVATTEIAFAQDAIDGIINIRGKIVTIVSLAQILNLDVKIEENSKIIICNIYDTKVGFVVDSISDILSIKSEEIKEQEDDEVFNNVLHLDDGDRLVMYMQIDKILQNKSGMDKTDE